MKEKKRRVLAIGYFWHPEDWIATVLPKHPDSLRPGDCKKFRAKSLEGKKGKLIFEWED